MRKRNLSSSASSQFTTDARASMERVEMRRLLSSVSGRVFDDWDLDGRYSSFEPGKANRTVYADYNYNGSLDAAEPRTLTDDSGRYTLDTRAANVQLRVVTFDSEQITLGYGATSYWIPAVDGAVSDKNFGIWYPTNTPSVRGTVFADTNRNCRLDAGEAGLAGRTVFVDNNYNGRFDIGDLSTTTDAAGNYQLFTVRSSNLQLGVVIRPDEAASLPFGAATLWVGDIIGPSVSGKNLGIAAAATTSKVTGTIYSDLNANGRLDAGEPGLAGRTVFADYNFNGRHDGTEPSALTDASGRYELSTRAQHVQVTLVTLPGEQITLGYGATSLWIASVNGTVSGKNIGVSVAQPTRVDLLFFPDYNGNGTRDQNEQGSLDDYADVYFHGWLDLDGNETQNEAAGEMTIPYESQLGGGRSFFLSVPPGTHRFQIRTLSDQSTLSNGRSITVVVGSEPSIYEIGVTGVAPISTGLFHDRNANGQWDPDNAEFPFADYSPFWNAHRIFLDRNGDGVQQPGENSFYESHYTGSGPTWAYFGTYTVTGLLPGEVFTTPRTIVVGPAAVGPVYVGIGGDVRNALVTGLVFFDANRNGRPDADESGLAGRTVFSDTNFNGVLDAGEATATTNERGYYSLITRSNYVQVSLVTTPAEQITLGYGAQSIWIPSIEGYTSDRNFGVAW